MASTGGPAASAASGANGSLPPPTPTTNQLPSQPPPPSSQTPQNLNNIVIEYLNKKGYNRTEAMLRQEMATVDGGNPIRAREDKYSLYDKTYSRLLAWIDNSLDLYKTELKRIAFPVFVHLYLNLTQSGLLVEAKKFYESYHDEFHDKHDDDLVQLASICAAVHVEINPTARKYTENKYYVVLATVTHSLLMGYLTDQVDQNGGGVIINILNTNCHITKEDKQPFLGLVGEDDMLGDKEGIRWHTNRDATAFQKDLPAIKLGLMPMDKELVEDVEYELALEDAKELETREEMGIVGPTLMETFQHIKREESEDTPMREDIPLPAYKQADIDAEVRAVKDYREKLSLENISGQARAQQGVEGPPMAGALPSVLTYTFHNTSGGIHRVVFSQDTDLCATSHAESFVQIWSLKGQKLYSMNPSNNHNVTTTRRYAGHAGPVYGISFSRDAKLLLSASADKTIRLWSLQTHTPLVVYKGHADPVWDVSFGPFDHYFASSSWDRTARIWATEHIAPLRLLVGHLDSVTTIAWHPNSAYVVTGSADKTLRMWDMQQGGTVRLFNGHTAPVRCQQVSPNGKYLASGADDGTINIWDIGMGKRIKTMRGHAKHPIWSLSWAAEGQVLVSGGADNTIRVWSVGEDKGNNASNNSGTVGAEMVINGIGGLPGDATTKVDIGAGGAAGLGVHGAKGRKDKKEVVATNDHLAVYYTKRTPVRTVMFTKKNLVLAGGTFDP
ncbi:Transcription initiation factor TFIID subunit 5 [Arthrobotrys musiformis]|uniref:Transcription initiation factor TFIID subunit 5 n=1 Tax=Arthrobotrys musiformis TaxID=47236 RepID=A0AAV9W9D7_9PEZI